MLIRAGYELIYSFPQPTPMILTLNIHYSRASDLVSPDHMITQPSVPQTAYRDGFGNWCTRLLAPAGRLQLSASTDVGIQVCMKCRCRPRSNTTVQALPQETLVYLLGSRYCDTDRLSEIAWSLFSGTPLGWARVQAICDFVHTHLTFGYEHARATKTALDAYNERNGVCRDYAHLAIAFCRCMNIPARYCTGYLGDIGVPVRRCTDGFRRLVRSLFGQCLAHVRRPQQSTSHRTHL